MSALRQRARAAERRRLQSPGRPAVGREAVLRLGRGGHGHVFPMDRAAGCRHVFFDNDRHSTNARRDRRVGFRVGTEISRVLATGTNGSWAAHVQLTIRGRLPQGVHARDLDSQSPRCCTPSRLPPTSINRVHEYAGDLDQSASPHARRCSSPTEMRAYGRVLPAVGGNPRACPQPCATAVCRGLPTPMPATRPNSSSK